MKIIIKVIALTLCICTGIGSFAGCKKSSKDKNLSNEDSSNINSPLDNNSQHASILNDL